MLRTIVPALVLWLGIYAHADDPWYDVETTYQPSEQMLALVRNKLETLVRIMGKPGDPPIKIVYSHTREFQAMVDMQRPEKIITISRGVLESVGSEDEIAAIIAHEVSHTAGASNRTAHEKHLQQQREEIITADLGAIDRMVQAGYDPTAFREFFLKELASGQKFHSPLLHGYHSHPPNELRITAIDVELKRRHDKAAFPPRVGDPEGWLARYRASFEPPWSLAEKRPKNMTTLLDRAAKLTSLKNLPPHQQITFLSKLLFEQQSSLSGGKTLLITGMLYDPQVNPSPYIEAARYEEGSWGFYTRAHVPYGDKFVSAGGNHNLGARDAETLWAWIKETVQRNPTPESKKAAAHAIHTIAAAGWQDPLFASQRLRRFSSERVLAEQVKLWPLPAPTDDWDAVRQELAERPPEQKVQMLLDFLERQDDPRRIDVAFDELKQLSTLHWTYAQAGRYLKLVPKIHRPHWGSRKGIPLDWPSQKREDERRAELDSAASRVANGTQRYLKKLMSNPRVPLGLRMRLATEYFHKDSDWGWQESVAETHTFLDGLERARTVYADPARTHVMYDGHVIDLVLKNRMWGVTPFDVIELFEKIDFDWLRRKKKHDWLIGRPDGKTFYEGTVNIPTLEEASQDLRGRGEAGLADSLEKAAKQLKNASVDYTLAQSEKLQRHFWGRLVEWERVPEHPPTLARVHMALAKVGNTEFTDDLAEGIYLDKARNCAECLREVLDRGAIWDFNLRKRVFDRWFETQGKAELAQAADRTQRLNATLALINGWFPEPSYERAQAIEDLSLAMKTNYREAEQLEKAKFISEANHEGASFRIFSAIFNDMSAAENKRTPMRFVHFLIGKGPFPRMPEEVMMSDDGHVLLDPVTKKPLKTRGITSELFGPVRTKRLFDSLSPEFKAVAISPFFAKPKGLLANRRTRERIYRTILQSVEPEFRKDARVLMDALIHAQQKVAPFEENLTLAYLFAQSGRKGRKGGEVLKDLLESQGAVGISLGQKLYQRRLVPAKYLESIGDLQDRANVPTRFEAIRRAVAVLDLKNPDDQVIFGELLGSASAKIVMEIQAKDGEEAARHRALKMLREHFDRRLELEEAKLRESVKYLEAHGDRKFRSLGPLVEDLIATLRKQSDLRTDSHHVEAVKKLYRHGEVDKHGFKWLVSSNTKDVSVSKHHSQEPVIAGQTVRRLEGQGRVRVAEAIFDRDYDILLGDASKEGEEIFFERDRHMGNYMARLGAEPPEIHVIDYPLLTSIKVVERDRLFKLAGLLDVASSYSGSVPALVRNQIVETVRGLVQEPDANARKMDSSVDLFLKKPSGNTPTSRVLGLFARLQAADVRLGDAIFGYLTALGHLEGAGKETRGSRGLHQMTQRIRGMVQGSAMETVGQLSLLERCGLLLRRLPLRLRKR